LSQGEGVIGTERVALEPETVSEVPGSVVPRLAGGTELIGEYQGSGFQEPKYILRRADGQVIQLPRLLYLLAGSLDGHRDVAQVAARLSAELDRDLSAGQVAYLLDQRLRPAGILAADPRDPGAAQKSVRRPDPLLALRFRVGVISERTAWIIAGIFQAFFLPPVVLAALATFVVLDVVLVMQGGLGQLGPSALALVYRPELTLVVMALVLASAAFHECGHVAACRYGGARPGVMGFGIYLVWPALYSTVTDAYRLNRRGRLRTDLGGVYFNAIFMAGLSLAYLSTGAPWLLITLVLLHVETLWQFLPSIRLDGYYILSDLIGVPDLFSRMGPVLKNLIPGRPSHPRVQELKPWVRWAITLWVVFVIPFLLYFLILILVIAPRALPVVWAQLVHIGQAVGHATLAGELMMVVLGVIQMILLVLPWLGAALIFGMLGHRLGHRVRGAVANRRLRRDRLEAAR
jgi:putative peptide zinc metalloprotease protein